MNVGGHNIIPPVTPCKVLKMVFAYHRHLLNNSYYYLLLKQEIEMEKPAHIFMSHYVSILSVGTHQGGPSQHVGSLCVAAAR